MLRRFFTIIPAFVLFSALALCALPAVSPTSDVAWAKSEHGKFEFTDVTFPDGTTGTIRAGVKVTNKGSTAVASYFSITEEYQGQYQEVDGFSSTDRGEVLEWALAHYEDRQ